ncbi:MAG: glycosyltransferase, partial [bacterium]|nr:glycosyltransferase [bacterium]
VFHLREMIWTPLISNARKKYSLDEFDIYQFEMGMEFYRDARWVKELKRQGKGVIAFYHGTDVRNRGIIKPVDETCHLRLTSELDLLTIHPQLEYIFLPIDLSLFPNPEFRVPSSKPRTPLRIGHAARSRKLKGTAAVIAAVELLQKKGLAVELVLMENMPHEQVLQLKASCDIAVDQLTDLGGWGYGMSSLEFLAMGVPVITYMRPEYETFLPDHPFVNANEQTIVQAIERLIVEESYRRERAIAGRAFVEKYHEVTVVLRQLYDYLIRERLCSELPVPLQKVTAPRINKVGL